MNKELIFTDTLNFPFVSFPDYASVDCKIEIKGNIFGQFEKRMVWVTENRPIVVVQSLLEQIVAVGQLSRREHMRLTSTLLADHHLTDEERRQISRVLDYVQIGRLKLVD